MSHFGISGQPSVSLLGLESQFVAVDAKGPVDSPSSNSASNPARRNGRPYANHLSTHQDGAPLRTIDEVYKDCELNILTQNPVKNEITLELDERGILSVCTYFPNNCADDCSVGPTISNLVFKN